MSKNKVIPKWLVTENGAYLCMVWCVSKKIADEDYLKIISSRDLTQDLTDASILHWNMEKRLRYTRLQKHWDGNRWQTGHI